MKNLVQRYMQVRLVPTAIGKGVDFIGKRYQNFPVNIDLTGVIHPL